MHTTNLSKIGMAVKNDRLMIEPTDRPRDALDELLAQCDASAEVLAEDREWLESASCKGLNSMRDHCG